ncbi:MAG TPA: hypothetical protein VFO57_08795, partial [Burkholderiales bacterium]|nr:hypothetical protein [Burkholderiales bacterium]
MNPDASLREPLRVISSVLSEPGKPGLPVGPGRWHILFGGQQRPLLLPAGDYRLQKRWLPYFIGGRLRTLYATALLKLNALVPAFRLLPEFEVPRTENPARLERLPPSVDIAGGTQAAIQIGTRGPYQKASALLLSETGEELGLAKIALAPGADAMVTTEAGWLRELAGMPGLAGHVPLLLAEGRASNGRAYLVTSVAPATRATADYTPAHARFLRELARARLETLRFRASPCCAYLERALSEIEPAVAHGEAALLESALLDCRKRLVDYHGPFVLSQGDFAWWNIRLYEPRDAQLLQRRVFVFDWEYARAGANPLADLFHYHLIQPAAAGRRIGAFFCASVLRRAQEFARETYPEWKWRASE